MHVEYVPWIGCELHYSMCALEVAVRAVGMKDRDRAQSGCQRPVGCPSPRGRC